MSFASGPATFRRYQVTGYKGAQVDERLLDALAQNAFGRYGSAAEDDLEVGWITPVHLFDVGFALEKVAFGRFAYFRMRMDRNSAPASILRSYIEIERLAAIEASDRGTLSKADAQQAKDAARTRATKEAKSGAFRRISAQPVLFDVENRTVYFGGTAAGANERFVRLFEHTFDVSLQPINAHTIASQVSRDLGVHRSFEDARPAHLVEPPDGVDGDVYSTDAASREFLGREFLSWLWWRMDAGEGLFEVAPTDPVAATLVRVVQLRCDFSLSGKASMTADQPGELPESRAALAHGKQPEKLGLILAGRAEEWTFTIAAATMDVSSLSIAAPRDEEPDASARLEDRFMSIADLASTVDRLYGAFLKLRFSSEWMAALGRMKQWASYGRVQPAQRTPRLATAS